MEIAKQTSGELTSVEVITYVEALCRSTSTLASKEKDYTVKPSAINSTLTVTFVHQFLCIDKKKVTVQFIMYHDTFVLKLQPTLIGNYVHIIIKPDTHTH